MNKKPETSCGIIAQSRDRFLIARTLQGDHKSFSKLMSLYKRRIYALGMSFFKNETDTEDFVQDVFIRIYTKLGQYRGESSFSTWIIRLSYNIAVNAINRRKEYASIADETLLPDANMTPEEQEIRKITLDAVHQALKELPKNYGMCLDMYFFYDMSYQDICDTTGFPINTIKSHIFRAKKILREKLEEMYRP